MEETMQHIEEVEREEQMQENDTGHALEGEGTPTKPNLNGSARGDEREAAPNSTSNSTTKLGGKFYSWCIHQNCILDVFIKKGY